MNLCAVVIKSNKIMVPANLTSVVFSPFCRYLMYVADLLSLCWCPSPAGGSQEADQDWEVHCHRLCRKSIQHLEQFFLQEVLAKTVFVMVKVMANINVSIALSSNRSKFVRWVLWITLSCIDDVAVIMQKIKWFFLSQQILFWYGLFTSFSGRCFVFVLCKTIPWAIAKRKPKFLRPKCFQGINCKIR